MEIANKYIFSNYEIKERYVTGIVLTGPEVKSCKMGAVSFKGAYCTFQGGELLIKNFHISTYVPARGNQRQYDPIQNRKLLLLKSQLRSLFGKSKMRGATIIPLRIFTKSRLVKVEIALAFGLKKYDKREKIKERDY